MHPPAITRRRLVVRVALAAILIGVLGLIGVGPSTTTSAGSGDHFHSRPTVVLVHGSFADASGFNDVIQRLLRAATRPSRRPIPLRGLASDAAYIQSVLDSIDGPIVLVAHSYGGMVITNAATGDPDVEALVYINGFAPAEGETAATTWRTGFPAACSLPRT